MKPLLITGVILILIGIFIAAWGLSYNSRRNVVSVGDFKASVEERRPIPAWVGGLVILGGAALVYFGIQRGPHHPASRDHM